jgi:GH25 family lysozyme M1 (1,4-beta-N-acetylmuramidase)
MALALAIGVAGPLGASAQQPPVDPTHVVPPGPGVSPNQAAINTQIQTARAHLAVTSRQAHPGKVDAVTNPQLSHAGTGSSKLPHPQVAAPNAVVGPSSTASLPGLDVSGFQGNVDWAQVKANGAQFAYVKATEGTYFTSSYFPQQYNGSYQQGLVRGAYHFGIPNYSSGAAQADFFVGRGGAWSADNQTLPGALDIEYNPYGAECYGLTQPQMVDWINAFANEYHALTSRWPALYSTTDWLTTCAGNSATFGANDPLWIANYNGTPNPLPAGWSTYTFWQFADHGTFPGDQDTFNGSHDQLVSLANTGPTANCTVYSSAGTGSHQVCGAIRDKYLALGGPSSFLGYPTTDELVTPDGTGRFNHFANSGSIYWTPSTGAWSIHGAIRDKWASMGWELSVLGYPTSDETGASDGVGRFNNFNHSGSIYWTPSTGAWSIHGAILAKYQSLGGPSSFLGYPVTDETGTPDGVGRFNHFSNNGSIYWTPGTGAWSIHGAVRAKWASLGWETGFLGYPVTDETGTLDGIGRFNNFANSGSIYWTPSTGAWSVHGAIRTTWASMGSERSCLGYPVGDESAISGGRQSNFQHGFITWTASTGETKPSCS